MKNIISNTTTIKESLAIFNELAPQSVTHSTIFIINAKKQLIGVLTEGDIRRALLNNISLDSPVELCMNKNFKYFDNNNFNTKYLTMLKNKMIRFVPLLKKDKTIIKILDLQKIKAALPLEVVFMAGGKGERLKPLTENTPKPMLLAGSKPIIEHALDYLTQFGITQFHISVNYLKENITDYFKNGANKGIQIDYVHETKPLGTIGGLAKIKNISTDYFLLQNGDLITNLNYEAFYNHCIQQKSEICIATVPYNVDIPFAILETKKDKVSALKEKPRYTYQANAGIYLIHKKLLKFIPKNEFFNATDLIDLAIEKKFNVSAYPILGYWTDVGRMDDYQRIQLEIDSLFN